MSVPWRLWLRFVAATVLLIMAALLVLTGVLRWRYLGPAPLTAVHRRAACETCHGEPWERATSDAACLSCHRSIAQRISAARGVHGQPGRGACVACHRDHGVSGDELRYGAFGSAAGLRAQWQKEPARHDLPRFVLRAVAGHRRPCAECHRAPRSFGRLGEPGNACARCHADAHAGKRGADCLCCHRAPGSWRDADARCAGAKGG